MSTRLHRFVPLDVQHIPPAAAIETARTWLAGAIAAYKVEAVTPGHITFFDCGGGLDRIFCPHCKTELDTELWKDWMDASWSKAAGFTLTARKLACCGQTVRLDALGSDPLCAFGSFALVITDTMKSLSDAEFLAIQAELETRLGCALQQVDAHY